ncbi:tetratricopeptide repeat protein, partial [Streptomyces sp. NPDC060006]|uniref:tetratricopeptide repeat protein n=1 Tax=Streptomyces sp. NPDC060006 TaxID=3347035 RepID=UPI0036B143FD
MVLSPEVTAEFATWAADHPRLDALADNVASTGELGFPLQASSLASELVARATTALGAGHPATLAARHAHSYWVGQAGDIRSALDTVSTLHEDCVRHLDPMHDLALLARLRQAAWLHRNGLWQESRRTYAELARLSPAPSDGRFVLLARLGRAQALAASGQYEEARDQLAELLAPVSHSFGAHHPVTLQTHRAHADATGEAGQPRIAYALLTDLARATADHFDPVHPEVLRLRHHQVSWCWAVEPLEEALRQAHALDRDCSRLLGEEHPDTLTARHLLGKVLYDADLTEARSVMAAVHAASERVLGPDHPDTLISRSNLASVIHQKEGAAAALPLFRNTLAAQERILGTDHPDTLSTRNNLAVAIHDTEGAAAALPLS